MNHTFESDQALERYKELLENKIIFAEDFGQEIDISELSDVLLPHQKDIVPWCIKGGRRAIFASWGLGKTLMQLEIARLCIKLESKPFLICMPLGVVGEFKRDIKKLKCGLEVEYITDTDSIDQYDLKIYVTNYERVRKGDIDPSKFAGVSFDEASILRNLKTETTNYVIKYFKKVKFRFVATATPTPNDYIEILNYADYLGVIDRGHALTRFFQRDSQHAGHLKLYENKKEEFWKWVSTWAVFINKPSDLGHDDTGYLLPKMHIHEIEINNDPKNEIIKDAEGNIVMFKPAIKGLPAAAKEKQDSKNLRIEKAFDIVSEKPREKWILWSDLEPERILIEKKFKDFDLKSVYGSQSNAEKEKLLIDFSEGEFDILNSKAKIAGSGCNFQHVCCNMIFVGINYKFNDFIQAIHRIYRFMQMHEVHIYILFTNHERKVLKDLKEKWRQHIELNEEMINLVREYGLNSDKIKSDMKRKMFTGRRESQVGDVKVYNDDTVIIHNELPSNSVGLHLSSWPFGDHYEYSDNYNDFGHNHGNKAFFKQMDHLTPNLLRTLMPGRIMAVHVKDRIQYSHQNGTKFTTISDFSGDCVSHCIKHGFYLVGKITVTTDVVRENNQTYRLTWGEQRKDGTKMGVGLPEYILLFRKAPTGLKNGYADDPVIKKIDDYLLSLWQLDAHSFWKSDGNRMLTADELSKMDVKAIYNWWKKYDPANIYNFKDHVALCDTIDSQGKLSKLFMTLPPHSNSEMVWTDINRMNTLNANQVNQKKEKHICPLQLDIIERVIYRFTNEGDTVDDCFGGLFSTPYVSMKMKRKSVSVELKPEYYDDGLFYLKSIEYKMSVPTLFDLI